MATISLGFNLSASAVGMSQGINSGVVELQKLGYAAKQTARDVSTLKTIEIGRVFLNSIQAVASTFTSFTSGASNAIDQTNKLSRALGISFEELQQLQLAADLAGANSEQLANAFTRAQVTITKAARGGAEASRALRSLGLSVNELAGLSSSQQFERIATAIAGIQNPAQRAAAAVAIFGRSGAQLLPTFQELAKNLRDTQNFFGGFKGQLSGEEAQRIEDINDAFTRVNAAITEVTGKVLSQLQPALLKGTDGFIRFLQSIDVPAAAANLSNTLSDIASVFSLLARAAAPLAGNLLPAIGGALAFINRQAIASAVTGLARAFTAAATAALGYAGAAGTAAAATTALAASIRAAAISTGVGAIAVAVGIAGGALLDWALTTKEATNQVVVAVEAPKQQFEAIRQQIQGAGNDATAFGQKVKDALQIPQIDVADFAQDSLNQAQAAFTRLADELGGVAAIPREIRTEFAALIDDAELANKEVRFQRDALDQVSESAKQLAARLTELSDRRKRDAEAARAASDAARKAAQDARNRVGELANQSLPASEQSRLQLMKDMVAVTTEQRAAEEALQAARRNGDAASIAAAEERLRLAQAAGVEARNQDRRRQLEALGVDANILKPAKGIADQFLAVRRAFDQKLIDGGEARQALQNLAAEGIRIRGDIVRELNRPSQRALEVSDIRSSEGIRQFLGAGREDPAVAQRREQLAKLDEIRRALIAIGANPVDILGA